MHFGEKDKDFYKKNIKSTVLTMKFAYLCGNIFKNHSFYAKKENWFYV